MFDQEEKGFISVQEFEQALQEIPGSNDIPASEMMEIIAMADPDGDGHIKYEGQLPFVYVARWNFLKTFQQQSSTKKFYL